MALLNSSYIWNAETLKHQQQQKKQQQNQKKKKPLPTFGATSQESKAHLTAHPSEKAFVSHAKHGHEDAACCGH